MDFLALIFTAIGLAMDAFAVSITNGLCIKDLTFIKKLSIALAFGIAQGVMPILGWAGGQLFAGFLNFIDHWVALMVLSYIGIKMIYEAIKERKENAGACCAGKSVLTVKLLISQAIATSIDAMAVGISFALIRVNILSASALIAAVTFLISLAGIYIGRMFGCFVRDKAEIAGGLILIFIGFKIFLEHILG